MLHFCLACMPAALWMLWGIRQPAGGPPSEANTAAGGSAAAGVSSTAGAALLARESAGLSAVASRSAHAREANGTGADVAPEARREGDIGTNQIGVGLRCCLLLSLSIALQSKHA